MKQIFIQTADSDGQLAMLRHRAEKFKFNKVDIMAAMKAGHALGDDPMFRLELPVGVRVVLTVEEHPSGWFRHLSVSIAHAKLPNTEIVKALMPKLGFRSDFSFCQVYVEGGVAVNVLEPIVATVPNEPNATKLTEALRVGVEGNKNETR